MYRPVPKCPALMGRLPPPWATSPPLANEVGSLQERITSTRGEGSITSVQAVYVPADDLTDPSPPTTFAPFGRHRIGPERLWNKAFIRLLTHWNPPPACWNRTWWATGNTRPPGPFREVLQRYRELQDIMRHSEYGGTGR